MRKILFIFTLISFLTFGFAVLAQEAELPNPGLTPDSPLYFLDTLGEKIGMFFTFGAEKKAEKAIKYAEEKLAEVKVMAEKNKTRAIEKANQNYQKYLGLVNEKVKEAGIKGKDVERLVNLIKEKTTKHQEILSGVLEKVPEQAKSGIEEAIEASKRGFKESIEVVQPLKQTIKIPIFKMMPFASEKESRQNICGSLGLTDIDEQTRGNLQTLCSPEYDNLSSVNKDKVSEMFELVSSIQSRKEVDDYTKIVADNLFRSSLPSDPEVFSNEVNLPSGYEEFLKECDKVAKKIKEDCPANGYSSWFFKQIFSFYDLITGDRYEELSYDVGGPCYWSQCGATEVTHVKSEYLDFRKIFRIEKAGKKEVEKTFQVNCHSFCNSWNCPKYEEGLKGMCKDGYLIYYQVDWHSYPEGSPEREERKKYVDEEIIVRDCKVRGKTLTAEKGEVNEKEVRKCDINKKGFWIFGEKDCGYTTIDGQSVRYCCCSCARPETKPITWTRKQGKLPKIEEVVPQKEVIPEKVIPKEIPEPEVEAPIEEIPEESIPKEEITYNQKPIITRLIVSQLHISYEETPHRYRMTLDASDPDGNLPLTYQWSINCGYFVGDTNSNIVEWRYDAPGECINAKVTVKVTDSLGLSDQLVDYSLF